MPIIVEHYTWHDSININSVNVYTLNDEYEAEKVIPAGTLVAGSSNGEYNTRFIVTTMDPPISIYGPGLKTGSDYRIKAYVPGSDIDHTWEGECAYYGSSKVVVFRL